MVYPLTAFDDWEPEYNCEIEDRVGVPYYGDGPKFVCGTEFLKQKDCLVYSLGSFQQDGFERAILARAPNCEVRTRSQGSAFMCY
jgi:Methyltransferase domain